MQLVKLFVVLFVWLRIVIGLLMFLLMNVFVFVSVCASCVIFCLSPKMRARCISAILYSSMHFIFIFLVKALGGYDLFIDKSGVDFSKPAIYVSNHISLFDPLLLFGIIPNLGVVIKKKYSSVLAIWLLVRAFDFVVVKADGSDETKEILQSAKRSLDSGRNMLIFPEGRRSKPARILEFKKSAFRLAKDLNVNVVPIAMYSPRPFLPKGEFLIKEKTYYNIKFLKPLNPSDYKSVSDLSDVAYDAISAEVRRVRDKSQEREQKYI